MISKSSSNTCSDTCNKPTVCYTQPIYSLVDTTCQKLPILQPMISKSKQTQSHCEPCDNTPQNKMCVPAGGVSTSDGNCGVTYTFPTAANQALVSSMDSMGNLTVDFQPVNFSGGNTGGGTSSPLLEGNLIDIANNVVSVDLSEAQVGSPAVYGSTYVIGVDGLSHLLPSVQVATQETAITTLNSSTVNLQAGSAGNGHTGLTANVKIDPSTSNSITVTNGGLMSSLTPVQVVSGLNGGGVPTAGTYSVSVNGQGVPSLTASLQGGGTETSVTVNQTSSIELISNGTAGHTLTANLQGYGAAIVGYHMRKGSAGIEWVPAPVTNETALTVNNTNQTVILTAGSGNGHTGLSANVRLDPQSNNALVSSSNGLYVPTPSATAANLGYNASSTQGVVTSSSGSSATIPTVTTSNAGLATPSMLNSIHVPMTVGTSNSVSLTTSGTNNQTLTAEIAGYSGAGLNQIPSKTAGGITWITPSTGGSGATDLSYTASPTNGIVVSSSGNNATLPLVTGTNAGLSTPALFTNSHVPMTIGTSNSLSLTGTGTNGQTLGGEIAGFSGAANGTVLTRTAGGVAWSTPATGGGATTNTDIFSIQVEADWFTTANETSNASPIMFVDSTGAFANGVITGVMFSLNGAALNAASTSSDNATNATTVQLLKNGTVVPTTSALTINAGAKKVFFATTGTQSFVNGTDELSVKYISGDTNKHILVQVALKSV